MGKYTQNKGNLFRFTLQGLVFSSNVLSDTIQIFFMCNGLNDPKHIFLNGKK